MVAAVLFERAAVAAHTLRRAAGITTATPNQRAGRHKVREPPGVGIEPARNVAMFNASRRARHTARRAPRRLRKQRQQ